MTSQTQRAEIEAVFAGLIGRDEIDVMPAEDADGIEVQADQWTLAVEGEPVRVAFLAVDDEPVRVAFLAVDDEPGNASDLRRALEATLEPDDLAALRELDRRWSGALRMALQESGDLLSMQLATLLAEEPEARA